MSYYACELRGLSNWNLEFLCCLAEKLKVHMETSAAYALLSHEGLNKFLTANLTKSTLILCFDYLLVRQLISF